jgi:hypothetical protein
MVCWVDRHAVLQCYSKAQRTFPGKYDTCANSAIFFNLVKQEERTAYIGSSLLICKLK